MSHYASLFTGTAPKIHPSDTQARAAPYRMLLVDDEPNVLSALQRQARAIQPDLIRIMLTGHADTGAVMAAINEGLLRIHASATFVRSCTS